MGAYVDTFKYAGGSFALLPRSVVRELNDACHSHQVDVSTGGFLEYVLTRGPEEVDRYRAECRDLGFDIVEISSGFVTTPLDDFVTLTRRVQHAGLKAKAEVGSSSAPAAQAPSSRWSRRARATSAGQSSSQSASSRRART
jgi:phosphosulfolactate synthase (CoM biosynthesis protein A)